MAQSCGAMKAVPLAVAGAFHTEVMRPADQRCAEALADALGHDARGRRFLLVRASRGRDIAAVSACVAASHDQAAAIRARLER